MTGLLKSIFAPNDGSRKKVQEAVTASRENVEKAASRFEDTVRELLQHNDSITGRNQSHAERN